MKENTPEIEGAEAAPSNGAQPGLAESIGFSPGKSRMGEPASKLLEMPLDPSQWMPRTSFDDEEQMLAFWDQEVEDDYCEYGRVDWRVARYRYAAYRLGIGGEARREFLHGIVGTTVKKFKKTAGDLFRSWGRRGSGEVEDDD